MRETRDLINFWKSKSADRLSPRFILATLVVTEGSTYRKAGAKKLIREDRLACGLLSGGCLEGEIIDRALEFLNANDKQRESLSRTSFDTTSDSDRLFGYQKGCRGKITLQFHELGEYRESLVSEVFGDVRPRRVVIFGCGPDAQPVSELLHFMGWPHIMIDHRRDLVSPQMFPWAESVIYESAESSVRHVAYTDFVLVMTHNFEADLHILRGLTGLGKERLPKYLGFLGPRTRFDQLQTDLKSFFDVSLTPQFLSVVRAPVGLKINSFHPSEIALSIVSEMQSFWNNKIDFVES